MSFINYDSLTATEKLIRARVSLQDEYPFYSYLLLHMTFHEVDEKVGLPNCPQFAGIAIDHKCNLYYTEKFVHEQTEKQLQGVLCHEILHPALMHLMRLGQKDQMLWNIATDIKVNEIIIKEGLSLPDGGIMPTNNSWTLKTPEQTIPLYDIDKKPCEELYDEMYAALSKKPDENSGKKPRGSGGDGDTGFDGHIYGDGEDENGHKEEVTETEIAEQQSKWLDRLNEAVVFAKQAGKSPKGIEQLLKDLQDHQLPWYRILSRYMQALMPKDTTWQKRSKKSRAAGVYLPGILKEGIDVVSVIDLSGSIGATEKQEFLSEMGGIIKCFAGAINMRVLSHDVDVHTDEALHMATIDKLKCVKVRGGGGTSHKPVMDYIQKNVPRCKVAIFLTDGYSDLEHINMHKYPFDKVIVLTSRGINNLKCHAKIIHLKPVKDQ